MCNSSLCTASHTEQLTGQSLPSSSKPHNAGNKALVGEGRCLFMEAPCCLERVRKLLGSQGGLSNHRFLPGAILIAFAARISPPQTDPKPNKKQTVSFPPSSATLKSIAVLHNPSSFTLIWILACIRNIHTQNSVPLNLLALTHPTAC